MVPAVGLGAAIILSTSLSAMMVVQQMGARTAAPYLAIALSCLAVLSVVALRFFGIDILFVPSSLGVVASVALGQVIRMWFADRRFTRKLFESAGNAGTENKEASSRLMSGLRLLDVELPLSEAIVFEFDNEQFTPAARLRPAANSINDTNRNSVWREGVKLCEAAVASGKMITRQFESGDATSVALPLRHEHHTVGALLVRLTTELRAEDTALLLAVCAQIARNLQREEFCKSAPRTGPLACFSARATEKKLEALDVLQGLMTEQRCGTNVLLEVKEGIAIAYLDGTIAFVNSELLRLAKVSSEEVLSLSIFELLDHFRTDVFDEPAIAVRRVLQSGEPYEGELRYADQNLIFGLRISLVRDQSDASAKGQPLCLAIYVRDLTLLKEYEQLKSEMISLMSHELRTPLTSINGFAELLCNEDGLPEQAKEFVTIIANESQRLSRMINTFLAVTRLERKDKQEVLKIPLKVNDVVRETITSLQTVAKRKRIRLVEQPAHRLPPVAADRGLITQAVKNLVNNAIKYSPERTTVTVSTALEAEAVRISVEDRGFGIPPESRDRVWDKFYRVVREGQEKDEESTGLGLSFVREVVEQHGGQVDLESEEGRGSKFSFTLPRL